MKLGSWLAITVLIAKIAAAGPQPPVITTKNGVPEHQVLYRDRSILGDSWDVGYWVRVERYLTVRQMKKLVCAVVGEEKPKDYGRLWITFNYRLDSYNLVATEEYRKSRLGHYGWNKGLEGSPYSLFRRFDENGAPLPRSAQFSSFDHTRECPVGDDSSSGSDPGGEK